MREPHNRNNLNFPAGDDGVPEQDSADLQDALREFRDACHAAAERPDAFWRKQHSTIMARFQKPRFSSRHRLAMLWAPASTVVLLCLFLFVENSKAPTSDLAAGADQSLLVEVEHALGENYPDALAPAALLSREIEQMRPGSGSASNPR